MRIPPLERDVRTGRARARRSCDKIRRRGSSGFSVVANGSTVEYWRAFSLAATPVGNWQGQKTGAAFLAAGAARPAWSANGAAPGFPGVTFDGAANIMTSAAGGALIAGLVRVVFVFVWKDTIAGATAVVLEQGPTVAANPGLVIVANDPPATNNLEYGSRAVGAAGFGVRRTVAAQPLDALICHSLDCDASIAGGGGGVIANGVVQATFDAVVGNVPGGVFPNDTIYLGARSGPVVAWPGTIASLAMLNNPTATELDLVMRTMALNDGGISW